MSIVLNKHALRNGRAIIHLRHAAVTVCHPICIQSPALKKCTRLCMLNKLPRVGRSYICVGWGSPGRQHEELWLENIQRDQQYWHEGQALGILRMT